ncbi:hypothetical protein [Microbacterium maritypicum]
MFKSRLADDPSDDEARTALVSWYRQNGHNDQAGRYAIAIDGAATADEVRAYSSMLRGLRANERRMRELSRLPDDAELLARVAEQLSSALEARRNHAGNVLAGIARVIWVLLGFVILVTLISTFIGALRGWADLAQGAAVMGLVSLGLGALASLFSSTAAAVRRSLGAFCFFLGLCVVAIRLGFDLVPIVAG